MKMKKKKKQWIYLHGKEGSHYSGKENTGHHFPLPKHGWSLSAMKRKNVTNHIKERRWMMEFNPTFAIDKVGKQSGSQYWSKVHFRHKMKLLCDKARWITLSSDPLDFNHQQIWAPPETMDFIRLSHPWFSPIITARCQDIHSQTKNKVFVIHDQLTKTTFSFCSAGSVDSPKSDKLYRGTSQSRQPVGPAEMVLISRWSHFWITTFPRPTFLMPKWVKFSTWKHIIGLRW